MGLTVKYKLKETWPLKITPYLCTRKWYRGNRPGLTEMHWPCPPPRAESAGLCPPRHYLPCSPAWWAFLPLLRVPSGLFGWAVDRGTCLRNGRLAPEAVLRPQRVSPFLRSPPQERRAALWIQRQLRLGQAWE